LRIPLMLSHTIESIKRLGI